MPGAAARQPAVGRDCDPLEAILDAVVEGVQDGAHRRQIPLRHILRVAVQGRLHLSRGFVDQPMELLEFRGEFRAQLGDTSHVPELAQCTGERRVLPQINDIDDPPCRLARERDCAEKPRLRQADHRQIQI